jgi:hypothetical protein
LSSRRAGTAGAAIGDIAMDAFFDDGFSFTLQDFGAEAHESPKAYDGVFAQAFEPPAQDGLSHLDALKGLLDDLENDLDAALAALDKENDAIGAEIQRMMEELAAANEAASQALDRLHPEGDDEDDDGDGDRDAWIKKV